MSATGPYDTLIQQWQRPLQMTAHALFEHGSFQGMRVEEKGRANGVINALVNGGMNKLDIARILGIEELNPKKRPFQLEELPENGAMEAEDITRHRLRMGLTQTAMARGRKAIVPAGQSQKAPRQRDVIRVGERPQQAFDFIEPNSHDALKLNVDPFEALPGAIAKAREWIENLSLDGDPYQNILWATAERFDISVIEAQQLLLRRLDYWTANLPGQEEARPARAEFPPISPNIDNLPTPTRDMRMEAAATRAQYGIHNHGRSHFTPTIPGTKEALNNGRKLNSPKHGSADEPTRVDHAHIKKLEALLADEDKLVALRDKFSRKKLSTFYTWVKDTMQIMKPGFDSTKYGFPITRAPFHDGWFMFYASLQERGASCSFNCHAKEVCYGGASGMTKRFNPDDLFRESFRLELQILARICKPEVRVMDMGDIPDGEFARMLVDTVTDPAIKDRAALWVVTVKHTAANPDAWVTYFDGFDEAERTRDMEVGNIMLAGAIRNPRQIRLQFSTMYKNIPASMRFSGKEEVASTTYAPVSGGGKPEKSASHCAMHSPKLAVDAREVFNLATGDVMDPALLDSLRKGALIKCSTCQACQVDSADPFVGVAIDLSGHGGKLSLTVNADTLRIDTSRGGSRELGTREVVWATGEVRSLAKAPKKATGGANGSDGAMPLWYVRRCTR